MAVKSIGEYKFPAADSLEKFHGNQMLYIGWDDHLMFSAPLAFCLSPSVRFGEICEQILPKCYSYHPDWQKVDLAKAVWLKSGKPWQPDMNKTLAEQGIGHKDALRFQTPGLKGIAGSCS